MTNFEQIQNKQSKICVVGLGYVGLPLAYLLSQKFSVIGFDINSKKIAELKQGIDRTGEVGEKIKDASMVLADDPTKIKEAGFIILAIPTPIDEYNNPDLKLLRDASALIGKNLSTGAMVVYESTVYPGVTEEICAPILEKESGLKCGVDFKIGYSPERVNPGDKEHTIDRIVKVVSGMDSESLDLIDKVYSSITAAGTFRAASIKVAEAAKAIENTQRDLNIALMNELSVIFGRMDISIYDVLAAAGTKWNFLKFTPGMVGPYYLTYLSERLGHHPEVILSGRRINDSMGKYIADQVLKQMSPMDKVLSSSRVAILGMTFKENVPDIRNSKVFDLYKELKEFGLNPLVYDPHANPAEVKHEYGIDLCAREELKNLDTIVVAVAHDEFKTMSPAELRAMMNADKLLVADVKHVLDKKEIKKLGINYWSL